MAIRVKKEHLAAINAHGEETYPHECCGFLLGRVEDGVNILEGVYRAFNEWPESSEDRPVAEGARRESLANRYLITPEQYKAADGFARGRRLGIIGYYHSHPDHPAAPSGFDLDHSCWPGESYLIVSVRGGKADTLNSFTKPDYTEFQQEEVLVDD
ncbi:MAG TPA: M67 family metallopeptidase [Blastocatellia bacterium]|nr:M67 family metallopeptidase [Blastocatellia bacterium]